VFGTDGLFFAARMKRYGATIKPRQNNTPTQSAVITKAEDFKTRFILTPRNKSWVESEVPGGFIGGRVLV
jgi:hypothetical protein